MAAAPYLLVFRDASIQLQKPVPRGQAGALLHEWLDWHERLEARGRLRFCSALEPGCCSVSGEPGAPVSQFSTEEKEPVIGYLLVDAANLVEAADVARGCPGLAHGFTVEIYRPFELSRHRLPAASPRNFSRKAIRAD